VATNACLDAIARDERRAVLGAKAEADAGWAGQPDDVVWLGPIPDSVLEPPTPPERTPEALTLMRETIEVASLTVIQLLTPRQRVALILCDVLDWSARDAADLLDINVSAVNSPLQRARVQAPRASAVAQAAVAHQRRWQRGRARAAEEIRRGDRSGGLSRLRIDHPRGRDLPHAAPAGHGHRP
jgi:RNA polymerase sigma-70 factor, ECF subfamily